MNVNEIRYHVFRDADRKNRAYVIDLKGNKVYYGTLYQCRKFIDFMKEGADQNGSMGSKRQAES